MHTGNQLERLGSTVCRQPLYSGLVGHPVRESGRESQGTDMQSWRDSDEAAGEGGGMELIPFLTSVKSKGAGN